MKCKVKVRLYDENDVKFFGKGVEQLLGFIDQEGSLNLASKKMGIAYSKAWKILHVAEEGLGFELLKKKSGGRHGGGSTLTPQGREFLEKYQAFEREIWESSDVIYQKYFGQKEEA